MEYIMMIPIGFYFFVFVIYELYLRLEASKYNKTYTELTYVTFKWAGSVLVNIFLLRAGKISKKMKSINALFIFAHLTLIISSLAYMVYIS